MNINNLNYQKRFTYLKNIPFNQTDLNCKGTKFQIVKFKPNTKINPHYHNHSHEIFYITKVQGILKLNNQTIKLKPNDFFLCKPKDIHEFINNSDEELVILIFKTNEKENDINFTKPK